MATSRSFSTSLVLLWLIGSALRLTILAVPPVIPALRDEFHLSGTDIGILTGLPVVLFAAAALAGSRLVARVGAVAAVVAGLMLAALGSALRAITPDVMTLFAATIVMGAGVAVTQPALPALVGRWSPHRIALGTGIYTNGLLIGEILPVAIFPLLFPLLGGSWRATFVFWAVPVFVIALLVMAIAPREKSASLAAPPRWWPDWPARDIWRLGLTFASASALYYASNAFLPGHLTEAGRADLINPALTALNLGQLPASLVLIAFGRHLERKAWPFVLAGLAQSPLCRLDCRDRGRADCDRRDRHTRLCHWGCVRALPHLAAALEHAARGRARVGGHVHHQLREHDGRLRAQRRRLGFLRRGRLCLSADRSLRAAVDSAGADDSVRPPPERRR